MAQVRATNNIGDAIIALKEVAPDNVFAVQNGDQPVTGDLDYGTVLDALGGGFDFKTFDLFTFLGLDPNEIFNQLKIGAMKNLPNSPARTVNEFVNDIHKLLIWYIQRGTSIERVDLQSRSKQGVPVWVNQIMARYGINQNLGNNPDPKHLTISRVVIVFPHVIAAAFSVGLKTPIATDDNLPLAFCFPQAAGMMTDAEWNQYREAYLNTMVKFTRIINRGGLNRVAAPQAQIQGVQAGAQGVQFGTTNNVGQMTDQMIKDIQLNYSMAARNSQFSIARRRAWRTQYRNLYNSLLAAIRVSNAEFNASENALPAIQ